MHSEDATSGCTKGSLLVAVPLLDEPTFHRTVIYMLQHNEEGAVGLVLNRPTNQEHLPGLDPWMHELSHPQVVFRGGPVQDDAFIAVAALALALADDVEGFAPLEHGLGTVDLSILPDEVAEALTHLRVFRGYSGWGASQLDDELSEGSWLVLSSEPHDVFCADPKSLWRAVLRRSGGHAALLSRAPDDLQWN